MVCAITSHFHLLHVIYRKIYSQSLTDLELHAKEVMMILFLLYIFFNFLSSIHNPETRVNLNDGKTCKRTINPGRMKGKLWLTDVAQVVQLLQVCYVYQQSQENGGARDKPVPQERFGVL